MLDRPVDHRLALRYDHVTVSDGRLTHPSRSGEASGCSRHKFNVLCSRNNQFLEPRPQPGALAAAEPTGIMSNKAII